MLGPVDDASNYLRLLARLLWQPGLLPALNLSDVVQRTLLQAHAKGHQFRGTTAAEWRGWLRAILRHELLRAARDHPAGQRSLDASSQRWEASLAADQTSPGEQAVRHEELARLAQALGRLSDDERAAVELKHLHGCSVEFISRELGRTRDAVAGLLKRGLRKLREALREAEDGRKG